MINITKALDSNKIFVLGAVTTYHKTKEKLEWLSKHYPHIPSENILFVSGSKLKLITIENYAEKLNLSKEDIVFVDDTHATIREVEEAGYTSYHVTSFVE